MASISGSGNGESVQFGRRPHGRASALNYDVGAAIVALQNQTPRNDGAAIVALRNQTPMNDGAAILALQKQTPRNDGVSIVALPNQTPRNDGAAIVALRNQTPRNDGAAILALQNQTLRNDGASIVALPNQTPRNDGAAVVAQRNQTPRNDGAAIVALQNQTPTDDGAAIVALQNQTPSNDGAAIVALQNQTPSIDVHENATPGDYVSLLHHLTGQISEVRKDYNNRGDDIVKISAIFVAFQGALIGSLFSSAGRIKESIQCHVFLNTLILLALFLSTLASLATIVLLLYYFLEQLKLLKLERQHQQQRHSVVDNCLQNARFTGSWRFLFSSYRRAFAVYGNPTDSCWWLQRGALIFILIGFMASFFFLCTCLLCP